MPVPPHDQSTPIRKPLRVVGVDGCKHGWVAVRLVDGAVEWAGVYPDFATLLASENATVVGVDIPINLPATGARGIDRLVRELLRPRQSTLFLMPPRPVMAASTHAEAVALCRELGLPGISAQGYALREKIFEVERVLQPGRVVVEVHPELSFTVMNGAPLLAKKSSWTGFVERKALLERHGLMLPGALPGLERAAVDDVVDAVAAAWTAHRVALEQARVVRDPEQPESALYA